MNEVASENIANVLEHEFDAVGVDGDGIMNEEFCVIGMDGLKQLSKVSLSGILVQPTSVVRKAIGSRVFGLDLLLKEVEFVEQQETPQVLELRVLARLLEQFHGLS